MAQVVEVVLWWGLLVGVWVITLSPPVPVPELVVATIAALACAMVTGVARRAAGLRWRVELRPLAWLAVLPVVVVADTARVFAVAVRQLARPQVHRGDFREVALRRGGPPVVATTRLALAITALSIPPSSFVVDSNSDEQRLLVHTLAQGSRWMDRVVG
jgi:multisubunit Na+/H+ antiporter MnhE subunit